MKKYGLQLRVPPAQHKSLRRQGLLALPLPLLVSMTTMRMTSRGKFCASPPKKGLSRILRSSIRRHWRRTPRCFITKEKAVRPLMQDRKERNPKYIQNLIKKAELRKFEQEIVHERKLAKERSKEDHLYADKDKFVTTAYKKKLAEQARWMEEERLHQLREEKDQNAIG